MRSLRILLIAGLFVSGCSDGGDDDAGSPTTSQTSDPTGSTSNPEPQAGNVLEKVALVKGDLPKGLKLELLDGGDEVEGQVTLDLCGYQFTTEEARAERHQAEANDAEGNRIVSDEGVLYQSARDAAAAMEEVRSAIRECPKGRPVESSVEGVPPLFYDLTVAPDKDVVDLAADRLAVDAVLRDDQGRSITAGLVYQRRGRVLVGTYGDTVAAVIPYAKVAAQRLAGLTAEEAGE